MRRFCIIANTEKENAMDIAHDITSFLLERECICVNATKEHVKDANEGYADVDKIPKDTECIIILGGDGTIIHAACDIALFDIPILGVNLGTVGFLADVEVNEVLKVLSMLIEDDYTISERLMMEGIVSHDGNCVYKGNVLNDIVVGRDGFSRVIAVNVYVNNELTHTLMGDGVLISTPTGSTGYNLSAGGPIIKPNSHVLVITPICDHSIGNRSLVVSDGDEITIEILQSKKTQTQEAIASFDGNQGQKMGTGDILTIHASEYTTKMINTNIRGYFDGLHKKIH